jgi:DNA repair exonuclease SbcCD ATPase subunit
VKTAALRVHGFGRLEAVEYRFGDGLTLVHGPNESGKSTLHAALAASLFGLVPGGRRTVTLQGIVERHRPWLGERYGSRLDLESVDGRRLRLDWDFARWTFSVVDAATGADLTSQYGAGTDADALCQALYGVSRDAYLRVGSVRQGELHALDDAAGVRQAIERVAGQGGGDGGASRAVELLAATRARLVGRNRARTNPLPVAEAEVARLEQELTAADDDRASVEAAAADRDRQLARVGEIDGRMAGLVQTRRAAQAGRLRQRVERAEAALAARESARRTLEETADARGCGPIPRLDALEERLSDLERRIATTAPRAAEAESERAALELEATDERSQGSSALQAAGWIGGLLLLAAGVALSLPLLTAIGAVISALGVIAHVRSVRRASAAAIVAADRRHERAARLEDELARHRALIDEAAATRAELAAALGVAEASQIAAAIASHRAALAAAAAYRDAEHRHRIASAELESALAGDDLKALRAAAAAAVPAGDQAVEADLEAVEQELAGLARERERALLAAERSSAAVDERLRALPDGATLREQLAEARALLERIRHTDAVLKLAEAELAEAMAETYRDFAPRLNDALRSQISRVSRGRYRTVYVDDDLNVRVEAPETGTPIDLGLTSTGTQRLAHLVQRLELVRLLVPAAEPLPVLLDDPFAHLDADRMQDALALLTDLAGERQLIAFTTQADALRLAPPNATVIELPPPGLPVVELRAS